MMVSILEVAVEEVEERCLVLGLEVVQVVVPLLQVEVEALQLAVQNLEVEEAESVH